MKFSYLLGIVSVILLPLGYYLLTDDALTAEIPQLEKQYAYSTPSVDNYDINLMAISETEADPERTLEQVVNYKSPADHPFQNLRLPEFETSTLLKNPLLCELIKLTCRTEIASQPAEVAKLLASHRTLLQQYEALQYLSDIQSAESFKVTVDVASVLSLEKLYALHIYQLMLEGDVKQTEYKLITLIKQQRRFLNHGIATLRRSIVISNFLQHFVPLALELSQRSASSRAALAKVMQPFTLHELTGIASKQYEFSQMLALVRFPEQGISTAEDPPLSYKLLYKPNLTANTLYELHRLAPIAQLDTKRDWYLFYNDPENNSQYADTNTLAYRLGNYRNLIGATFVSTFLPAVDRFQKQMFETDLQLYLLQPMLQSTSDEPVLNFNSFALNPYDNTSVVYINGQWCYVLEQDICLPALQ